MPKTVETIEEYLQRYEKIEQCGYFKEKDRSDFEFPVFPMGRQIVGQGADNLMVPRYQGQ